jgi:hypothetical protein
MKAYLARVHQPEVTLGKTARLEEGISQMQVTRATDKLHYFVLLYVGRVFYFQQT